ncbi:hypothetical protein Y032_0017g3288 [Ancylostoma ceylanicum]|uniref:Uncharacterized protein n=1 Tax=Ancylostoma ceylanicum TaxID=53326 RepID=A0A016V6G3_9BILA|nr:hypothetical protein Y032_0017g3288 [Ancylostoma ceylanicum]
MSRGAGKPHKHCICNTNMCNGLVKPVERYHLSITRDGTLRSRSLVLRYVLLPYDYYRRPRFAISILLPYLLGSHHGAFSML